MARRSISDPSEIAYYICFAPRRSTLATLIWVLITRLLKRRCELCEQTGDMTTHHVRSLAELGLPGPTQSAWAAVMARRKRKALVVCDACHDDIHARQPSPLTA